MDMDLQPMMDILTNPYLMAIVLLLTVVSTIYCWKGMRQRDMPMFLIGLGVGAPTFDIVDWKLWAGSILVVLLGFWLKSKSEGPLV